MSDRPRARASRPRWGQYLDLDPKEELTSAPTLFGETFQGPMPWHGGGMPIHYDLHKWVWK